ncbi:MAG: CBS domain-containing protein [Vicinamibacterales bacterium]
MSVTSRMSMTVQRIVEHKPEIYSTSPQATVLDALRLMAEKNVGALLVLDHGRLVGVVSERDYARKVILLGRTSRETFVRDVMSPHVIVVHGHDTAERCMALMTAHRVRHLPVVEADRLVGVVSIGDVVRALMGEQQDTINELVEYIKSGA